MSDEKSVADNLINADGLIFDFWNRNAPAPDAAVTLGAGLEDKIERGLRCPTKLCETPSLDHDLA